MTIQSRIQAAAKAVKESKMTIQQVKELAEQISLELSITVQHALSEAGDNIGLMLEDGKYVSAADSLLILLSDGSSYSVDELGFVVCEEHEFHPLEFFQEHISYALTAVNEDRYFAIKVEERFGEAVNTHPVLVCLKDGEQASEKEIKNLATASIRNFEVSYTEDYGYPCFEYDSGYIYHPLLVKELRKDEFEFLSDYVASHLVFRSFEELDIESHPELATFEI